MKFIVWTEKSFRLDVLSGGKGWLCENIVAVEHTWYLNLGEHELPIELFSFRRLDLRWWNQRQTHAIGNSSRFASVSNLFRRHVCICVCWLGFFPPRVHASKTDLSLKAQARRAHTAILNAEYDVRAIANATGTDGNNKN